MGDGPGRHFLLPIAAAFSGFVGFGAIVPVLPVHVRVDLGGTDVDVGIVVGVFSLAALSTRMVSGRFAGARGGAAGLLLGLGLCSLAGFLFLLPAGLAGLVVARMVQGFGQAFVFGGCAALTVTWAPADQKARALGLLGVGTWGGQAVGPLFGAAIGTLTGTALFVMILPLAMMGVILRAAPAVRAVTRTPAVSKPRLFPREALRPGVAQGMASMGLVAVTGFVVLRLAEVGGGGALAFGAFAASVLLSRTLLSSFVDRRGTAPGMLVGCVSMTVGLAFIALASTPAAGVIGAIFCGAGYGLPWPSLASFTLGRVGGHEDSSAIGALTAINDGANFVGAIVAGFVAGAFGYPAVFWFAAVTVLAAAALIVPSMRVAPPGRSPAHNSAHTFDDTEAGPAAASIGDR